MIISKENFYFKDSQSRNAINIRGDGPIYVSPNRREDVMEIEIPNRWGDGSNIKAKKIGAFSYFCNNCDLQGVVEIGRFCSISSGINAGLPQHSMKLITTSAIIVGKSESNYYYPFLPEYNKNQKWIDSNINFFRKNEEKSHEVYIGNDVWIGHGVTIAGGVRVGDGAVIGSESVVTHDVEPYTIVAGVPARVIRKRFDEDIIAKLLEIQWWDYGPDVLIGLDSDISKSIYELENRVRELEKWTPEKIVFDYKNKEIYLKSQDGMQKRLYRI